MDTQAVGQEAWQKIWTLTVPELRDDLAKWAVESGFTLSADNSSVVAVKSVDSLTTLAGKLKTSLPVALIGLKRVLSKHEILI